MSQDNLDRIEINSSTPNFTELTELSCTNLPLSPSNQPMISTRTTQTLVSTRTTDTPISTPTIQTPALTSSTQTPVHPQVLLLLLNQKVQSPDTNTKNIKVPLDYLNQVKEPSKIIEDERSVLALIEANELFRYKRDQINIIMESKLQLILKDLFYYIYHKFSEYVSSGNFDIHKENTEPQFTVFHLIVDLTEILIISSKEFSTTFHMIGGSKCFLTYFSNKNLVEYLTKSFTQNDPFLNERKMNYCKAFASMLNCLFYLKSSRTQAFRDLNTVCIITDFSNSLKFCNCELILRSYFILAGLARRKQIESLKNIDFAILILEKTIQMFAQATQKKTKYTSYQFDLFYENDMRSFEINTHDNANAFIIHMLLVVESFMVNDEIKYRMFNNIKNSLLILLFQGDLIEKYLALNVLTNFSFDAVLNEKIRTNVNLTGMLDQMIGQSNQLDEVIRSTAICLKKLLNIKKMCREYRKKMDSKFIQNDTSGKIDDDSTKKIVISFHESNELICLRIKNELEDRGFDIRLIHHKTEREFDIDRILKMIEESDCVLICFSASYEFEKVCQFEATYAHKLGKVLIPISVQSYYVPDYWVEEIFFSRRFYEVKLSTIKRNINFLSREVVSILKMEPMPFMENDFMMTPSTTCKIL